MGAQSNMTKKVVIQAPLLSRSGYGEHARLVVDALSSRPDLFDLYVSPTGWGKMPWITDTDHKRKYYDFLIAKAHQYKGPYDLAITVSIPNEFLTVAPKNIGITAGIETDCVTPQWIYNANQMDRLIVTSRHAKSGFVDKKISLQDDQGQSQVIEMTKPIDIINYPIKNKTPQDLSDKLKLDTDFNFLCVSQWGPRKDLENTIKWFVEEFKDENVGLVVKTSKVKNSIADRDWCTTNISRLLSAYPDRKCKIHLVHGTMTEEEIHGLYTHPDIYAYVTTTHGEGYGLPLFEAAYSGMPVIAPGWSGHMDFLCIDKKTKSGKPKRQTMFEKVKYTLQPIGKEAEWPGVLDPGTKWAYANEESYKKSIRKAYENISVLERQAEDLAESIKKTHAQHIIYEQFVDAVSGVLDNKNDEWQKEIETVETL